MSRCLIFLIAIWSVLAACTDEINSSNEVGLAETAGSNPTKNYRLTAHWRIQVRTESGESAELDIAIGYDQTLRMIKSNTPFEFEFVANNYTALISLKDADEQIKAEVWSDVDGPFQMKGGFSGGQQGKFTFHHVGPIFGSAGTGF